MKERFTTELVLVTLDLNKEMRVKINISNFAIEGVLLMKCEDKRWRLVAYISKSLMSKMKAVDSDNFHFLSHFYFIFDLFSFILFLELGLGLK